MTDLRQSLWIGALGLFVVVGCLAAQRGAGPNLAACGAHEDFDVIGGSRRPKISNSPLRTTVFLSRASAAARPKDQP